MLFHEVPEFVAHQLGVNIPFFDKAADSRQLLLREIIVRMHVADHIRTTCWLFAILEYDARNPAAAKQTGFLQRISADAGAMRVSDHRHSTRDRVWAFLARRLSLRLVHLRDAWCRVSIDRNILAL